MRDKKNTAVVFGLTHEYAFAVACVIMDIKKYSPNWAYEVVILHDGISINDQKLLNAILPCRFIKYDFPIKDNSKFNQRILNYFSKMVFSKFECLKLLDDYKNVVWLDYDIVIKKDISELTNYCDSGIKMMYLGNKVKDQLLEPVDDYNMKLEGISAGTFVFQDHIGPYDKMYKFCYNKTEKYAQFLKYPEQAIFDFMIQEFEINIELIDKDIYCVHPKDVNKYPDAKIIHSYGHEKFWNEVKDEQWYANYKNWLKMGGGGYNLNKYFINKKLKTILRNLGIYEAIKNFLLKIKN